MLEILVKESGKPRFEAEAIEQIYLGELTRFLCSRRVRRTLQPEIHRPFFFPNKKTTCQYVPRGVVGIIGPWNWPLLNNFADAIAPLMAGNAVVLKPSPLTPLTSRHIAARWTEEAPEALKNLFQVVQGKGQVGQQLVERVDMVFFTGSVTTGKK